MPVFTCKHGRIHKEGDTKHCPECAIDDLKLQIDKLKCHNQRLFSVIGLDVDWPEVSNILNETHDCSLAEIQAKAIESIVDLYLLPLEGEIIRCDFAIAAIKKHAQMIRMKQLIVLEGDK